jgi:hypothetical protein
MTWLLAGDEAPPKKDLWHRFYWEAWNALRYDRAYVGQMGAEMPISYMAIDAYARRQGIDGRSFDHLLRLVTTIDLVYIDLQAEGRRAAMRPTVTTTELDLSQPAYDNTPMEA